MHGHNVFSLGLVRSLVTALGLLVAFILKFRDNMFHVLTGARGAVAIFIYNASKPKDLEFSLQQEKLRVINGEVFERSRGDGEELELLAKTNTDSESEEESL
ncbi:hypothetical protein F7725_002510 [Dissostichus mawsoni]|uniref:Uncharacterized protein n=1 Tax=Dissostichus mawsoni TaxID=36200 RepID=A0A7J5Y3Q7_DISMA|nr:hypothetical protein F7725_002510 [Dissostichus mawsoni]